MGPITYFT